MPIARGMRARALLLVSLFCLPVASAEAISARLWSAGSAMISGDAELDLILRGASSLVHGRSLQGEGDGQLIVAEAVRMRGQPRAPPPLDQWSASPYGQFVVSESVHEIKGEWTVQGDEEDAVVLFLPVHGADLQAAQHFDGEMRLGAPTTSAKLHENQRHAPSVFIDGQLIKPHGSLAVNDVPGTLFLADQPMTILVHNATLTAAGETWRAGRIDSQGSPNGTGSEVHADRYIFLLLRLSNARVAEIHNARAYVHGFGGSINGAMVLNEVHGGLVMSGVDWNRSAGLLRADGELRVAYDLVSGPRSEWIIEGEVSRLAVDGQEKWSEGAVAVASAVLGLVLLLKILPNLALLLARHRAAPLANPMRRRIYEYIVVHPGCRRTEIASAIHTTRHNVMFHIGILVHHHLVDVERRGRMEHYMLNSGRYRKVLVGTAGQVRLRDAMATVRHPIRAQIVKLLGEQDMNYDEIRQAWDNPTPSKSLLSYHMKQLEATGLVLMVHGRRWSIAIKGGLAPWVEAKA